jgi:hypothetical protein
MSTKSHAHTKCGTLSKTSISTRGMLKFTYKGRFLTIKIAYEKFLDCKSERWKHALMPLLHVEIFIFEKYKNLDFWRYFEVLSMDKIWQFWAETAALIVAESLFEARLKSSKPHNS